MKKKTKKAKGKKGGLKSKAKVKKIPEYDDSAVVLGLIEPGELQRDVDSRFKEEMHVRRPKPKQAKQTSSDDASKNSEFAEHLQRGDMSPERFLHANVRSLKALAKSKKRMNKKEELSGATDFLPGGIIDPLRRSSMVNSVKTRKTEDNDDTLPQKGKPKRASIFANRKKELSLHERYEPPAGIPKKSLIKTVSRAKVIAGFRSGFLFLTNRPSADDIKAKLDKDNGLNHGLYANLNQDAVDWTNTTRGNVTTFSKDEDSTGSSALAEEKVKVVVQEKVVRKDAADLDVRLRRLASDSRQTGYLASDRFVPKAPEASMGLDELELEKHRAASRRALILNEMRNKEKAVAGLLDMQIMLMDAEHPTWIENEINRRYLLEAACMQKQNLVMPISARAAKAYPQINHQYKSPNLLLLLLCAYIL